MLSDPVDGANMSSVFARHVRPLSASLLCEQPLLGTVFVHGVGTRLLRVEMLIALVEPSKVKKVLIPHPGMQLADILSILRLKPF